MGVYLGAMGVLLLCLLVSVWPAVERSTGLVPVPAAEADAEADSEGGSTGQPAPSSGNEAQDADGSETTAEMSFLGLFDLEVTSETALLILVLLFGALGAYIHSATSFVEYAGNRRLAKSWTWWYLLRLPIGAALALILYVAFRGGLFAPTAGTSDVNTYGIAALAGAAGLFSKQATSKLEEVFNALFRLAEGKGDDRLKDSLENPKPTVTGVEPNMLTVGTASKLDVSGQGFIASSRVRLTRIDTAAELTTERVVQADTHLTVSIAAGELAEPGALDLTITNPEPGGGTSEPWRIDVESPLEAAALPATLLPAITAAEPPAVTTGSESAEILLTGSGFGEDFVVEVVREDLAISAARPAELSAPSELVVTLSQEELATAGTIEVSVVVAGQRSNSVTVLVED